MRRNNGNVNNQINIKIAVQGIFDLINSSDKYQSVHIEFSNEHQFLIITPRNPHKHKTPMFCIKLDNKDALERLLSVEDTLIDWFADLTNQAV